MQKTSTLICTFLITLAICHTARSQSDYREVGARFNSFDNFGVIYKKERSENRLTRFNLAVLNLGLVEGSRFDQYSIGAEFSMGWEKRKPIEDKLRFIHGLSPSIGFNHSELTNGTENSQTNIILQLGYILGLQYDISETLYVNIEVIPGLRANNSSQLDGDFWTFNLGGGTQSAGITIAYRFKRD